MGTIFEFPEAAQRSSGEQTGLSGCSAEIVIFPGVRYERNENTSAQRRQQQRVARERDLLELED